MLYSHSHQEKAFDFFASFIRNVLDNDVRYESMVLPVIKDAKSLASHEKDHFAVNRTSYDVIVYLAEKDPDFFKHLNTEHISKDEYQHILSLLTAQQELILA
jgi:hypothetical protein